MEDAVMENWRFTRVTWIDRVLVAGAFGLPIIISLALHFYLS